MQDRYKKAFEKIFVLCFLCACIFGVHFVLDQEKRDALDTSYHSKALLMIQAALGNPDKQYLLGLESESEPDKAFDLYRNAAAKGHLRAQIRLAFIYQHGYLKQDQKSIPKALEIYNTLLQRDYVPSEVLVGLCQIYLLGSEEDGIAVDHLRSFEYCSQAAERKDPNGLYYLYIYHTYKSDVPKEKLSGGFERGLEYFQEALKMKSQFAQREMSALKSICLTPDNIVHSADQAWNCERLASLGDPAAQFIMGGLYDTGTFRQKNTESMMYWFQRSSAQKYAKASAVLGIFYAQGKEGVEQNDRQALAYFQRAVNDSGGILPEEIEERAEYITMRNLHYAVMDEKRNTEAKERMEKALKQREENAKGKKQKRKNLNSNIQVIAAKLVHGGADHVGDALLDLGVLLDHVQAHGLLKHGLLCGDGGDFHGFESFQRFYYTAFRIKNPLML